MKSEAKRTTRSADALWRDPQYWTSFRYSCEDDPRVFVPKRMGIGYTVNFGHPAAMRAILLSVLVVGGVPTGAMFLAIALFKAGVIPDVALFGLPAGATLFVVIGMMWTGKRMSRVS